MDLKNQSVLDLGCGYKAISLQKKCTGNYVGLDSDINVVDIPNVYAFDMCQLWSNQRESFGNIYPYLKTFYQTTFNDRFQTILCLNAIHYAFKDPDSINSFQQNLDYFGEKNTRFIVRYLDSNCLQLLFDQNNNKIVHENGSFVRCNSDETITIYYNWVHNSPLIEPRINLNKLQKTFHNWSYQNELSNTLNQKNNQNNFRQNKRNDSDIWSQYFNCFTYAVFLKNQ